MTERGRLEWGRECCNKIIMLATPQTEQLQSVAGTRLHVLVHILYSPDCSMPLPPPVVGILRLEVGVACLTVPNPMQLQCAQFLAWLLYNEPEVYMVWLKKG